MATMMEVLFQFLLIVCKVQGLPLKACSRKCWLKYDFSVEACKDFDKVSRVSNFLEMNYSCFKSKVSIVASKMKWNEWEPLKN